MTTKEYLMEVKVKNNFLASKMKERNINAAQLAKKTNTTANYIGKALNLKLSLCNDKTGKIRKIWTELADFFDCSPVELLPEQHWNDPLLNNKAEKEISFDDMQLVGYGEQLSPVQLIDYDQMCASVKNALNTLSKREQQVLELRFGLNGNDEHTLAHTGERLYNHEYKKMGVQQERVRQIEAKALRKLKHPSRSVLLRPHLESIDCA